MKLSEFRSQLRLRLQEPQSTGRFSDAELDSYINRALVEVADQLELTQASSTVEFSASDISKPLPANLLRLIRASVPSGPLKTTDPLVLDTLSATWETETGTPNYYFLQGNDLRLYPIPTASVTVTLQFVSVPEPLTADDATSQLPSWTDEGVILYALYLARDSDNDERANTDWQKYQAWLQRAQLRVRHRTITPTLRVKVERRSE